MNSLVVILVAVFAYSSAHSSEECNCDSLNQCKEMMPARNQTEEEEGPDFAALFSSDCFTQCRSSFGDAADAVYKCELDFMDVMKKTGEEVKTCLAQQQVCGSAVELPPHHGGMGGGKGKGRKFKKMMENLPANFQEYMKCSFQCVMSEMKGKGKGKGGKGGKGNKAERGTMRKCMKTGRACYHDAFEQCEPKIEELANNNCNCMQQATGSTELDCAKLVAMMTEGSSEGTSEED